MKNRISPLGLLGGSLIAVSLALAIFFTGGGKTVGIFGGGNDFPKFPIADEIAQSLVCKHDQGTIKFQAIIDGQGPVDGAQVTASWDGDERTTTTDKNGWAVFKGIRVTTAPIFKFDDPQGRFYTGDRISWKHAVLQRSDEDCTKTATILLAPTHDQNGHELAPPGIADRYIDGDGWGENASAPTHLLDERYVSAAPVAGDSSEQVSLAGGDPRAQARFTLKCNGFMVSESDPQDITMSYSEAQAKGYLAKLEAMGFVIHDDGQDNMVLSGVYAVSTLQVSNDCGTRKGGNADETGLKVTFVLLKDGTPAVLDDRCLNLVTPIKAPAPTPTPTTTNTPQPSPTGTVPSTNTPTNTPTKTPTNTPTVTPTAPATKVPPPPVTETPVPASATPTSGCDVCKTPSTQVPTQPAATGTPVFTSTPTQCPTCEPERTIVGTRTPTGGRATPTPGIGDYP